MCILRKYPKSLPHLQTHQIHHMYVSLTSKAQRSLQRFFTRLTRKPLSKPFSSTNNSKFRRKLFNNFFLSFYSPFNKTKQQNATKQQLTIQLGRNKIFKYFLADKVQAGNNNNKFSAAREFSTTTSFISERRKIALATKNPPKCCLNKFFRQIIIFAIKIQQQLLANIRRSEFFFEDSQKSLVCWFHISFALFIQFFGLG